MESRSVADLVRRAREGERAAWCDLVRRHAPLVHAVCLDHGLGDSDADAVNQVVWMRAAEHLSGIRSPQAIGGWIAAVARSECVRVLQAHGRLMGAAGQPGDPSGDQPDGRPGDQSGGRPGPGHDEIGAALAGPAPAGWARAAQACFDWLTLDAELAELAYDAVEDVRRPGGSASGEGTERRRLRFDVAELAIVVELDVGAGAVRLAGRVLPAGPGPVRALLPRDSRATEAGVGGSFRLDDLPREPVSLLVERDTAVKTGWIVP